MGSGMTAEKKWLWPLAFVFAGVGCGLMGPLLPSLARQWALSYAESGVLLGLLLAGSCAGTLTLRRRLDRGVRRGVCCAAAGYAALAACTMRPSAYVAALVAVVLAGFGLGSLMSAVNLLAGHLPAPERTGALARVGAAWCIGAMVSPALVAPGGIALWLRLMGFSAVLLVLLLFRRAWEMPDEEPVAAEDAAAQNGGARLTMLACTAAMFLYGGAEACVSGWLPTFVGRYGGHPLNHAAWVTSGLWLGLIVSRITVPSEMSRVARERVLKIALPTTGAALVVLMARPGIPVLATGLITGLLIGPGFPLLLAGTLDWRLGVRRMAIVLAGAALGGAVLPAALGKLAMSTGLRGAILLPAIVLGLLPWFPRRTSSRGATLESPEPLST